MNFICYNMTTTTTISNTNAFIKQKSDFPLEIYENIPKPIVMPDQCQSFIITQRNGVFIYKPSNNEYVLISDQVPNWKNYNPSAAFIHHGHFIDPLRNLIYIFGGQFKLFERFSLSTKCFVYLRGDAIYDGLEESGIWSKAVHLPKQGEVHLFGGGPLSCKTIDHEVGTSQTYHCKFDIKTEQILNLTNQVGNIPFHPRVIYVPQREKIISFGAYESTKIHEFCLKEEKWSENKTLQMPHDMGKECDTLCEVLCIGNMVIAAWKVQPYCIWILDLLQNIWFKSNETIPSKIYDNSYFLQDHSGLYLIDFDEKTRYIVDISELVPDDMKKLRSEYVSKFVFGYLRKEEDKLDYDIPFALKNLIASYFPFFYF